MIIETEFGKFELLKDYREAFDIVKFQERYVKVTFDKYTYIVGDVSSEKLRLKGFSKDPKSKRGFKHIPDYLNESCAFNGPYFILKRVKE